jgi:catechol 2,3-dioxygenase-like lactoylglutathione lyase family enzyme
MACWRCLWGRREALFHRHRIRPCSLLPDTSVTSWSIDQISAVTLPVTSMRRSVGFYQRIGFDISYGGRDAAFTTMRVGDSVINLRRVPLRVSRGWGRVILRVRGVDALHRDLVEKGFAPDAPRDAEWGERYFEISDPDGFVISFAERSDRSRHSESATANR